MVDIRARSESIRIKPGESEQKGAGTFVESAGAAQEDRRREWFGHDHDGEIVVGDEGCPCERVVGVGVPVEQLSRTGTDQGGGPTGVDRIAVMRTRFAAGFTAGFTGDAHGVAGMGEDAARTEDGPDRQYVAHQNACLNGSHVKWIMGRRSVFCQGGVPIGGKVAIMDRCLYQPEAQARIFIPDFGMTKTSFSIRAGWFASFRFALRCGVILRKGDGESILCHHRFSGQRVGELGTGGDLAMIG